MVKEVIIVVGYCAVTSTEQSHDYFFDMEKAEKFKFDCEAGKFASDEDSPDFRAPAEDDEMMYYIISAKPKRIAPEHS